MILCGECDSIFIILAPESSRKMTVLMCTFKEDIHKELYILGCMIAPVGMLNGKSVYSICLLLLCLLKM